MSQADDRWRFEGLDQVRLCVVEAASSRDEDEWVEQDFLVLEPELASQEWEELQEQLEELHSLAESLTQHVQASTMPWSICPILTAAYVNPIFRISHRV